MEFGSPFGFPLKPPQRGTIKKATPMSHDSSYLFGIFTSRFYHGWCPLVSGLPGSTGRHGVVTESPRDFFKTDMLLSEGKTHQWIWGTN